MSNRGGARVGSGRKKKLVANLNPVARDLAIAQIQEMTPEIIGKLAELARGVTVQNENLSASGNPVYTKPPDKGAIELLLSYGIGKPSDRIEVTGKDGKDLMPNMSEEQKADKLSALLALAAERKRSSSVTDSRSFATTEDEAQELRLRLSD